MFDFETMNVNKIRTIVGALLINVFARPLLYWGNMSPYVMSYLAREDTLSKHHYLINTWFVFTFDLSWTFGMLSNDIVLGSLKSVTPRYLVAFGMAIFNASIFGSVLAFYGGISWNVYVIVFGLISGLGVGSFECLVIRYYVVDWSGNNERGLLTAIFIASSNIGAAILNKSMTFWVNPANLPPDLEIGNGRERVFSQDDIIDKTPSLFLAFGGANLFFQFIGLCLVKDHPCQSQEIETLVPQPDYDTFGHNDANKSTVNPSTQPFSENTDNVTSPPNTASTQTDAENKTNALSTILEFVVSSKFLTLGFIYYCMSSSETVAMIYYKVFGLVWIPDDTFFANLGTTTSIMASVWTVVYGLYFDRFGSKIGLMTFDVCLAVATLLMYFTARLNKWAYFVCTMVAYGTATSMYISIVATVVDFFGKEHLSRNVALINMAISFNAVTMSAVGESLIPRFGWFSVFAVSTSMCLIALIIIILRVRK